MGRSRETYKKDRERMWEGLGICDRNTGKPLKWKAYRKQFILQGGSCNWCGMLLKLFGKGGCADHCHIDGCFRQILCQRCNRLEGILGIAEEFYRYCNSI